MSESINDRLKGLPLRAIVAFAVRCARRVQPLTRRLPKHGRDAVERTIQAAEEFARGNPLTDAAAYEDTKRISIDAVADSLAHRNTDNLDPCVQIFLADFAANAAAHAYEAANAAAHAIFVDATYYAASAVTSANRAADIATNATHVTDAAFHVDLDRLAILMLGQPRTRGLPIDPSEDGPLGPLWPYGAPLWYLNPPRPDEG